MRDSRSVLTGLISGSRGVRGLVQGTWGGEYPMVEGALGSTLVAQMSCPAVAAPQRW